MNRTPDHYKHLACLLVHDIKIMSKADPENEALERLRLVTEHMLENPEAAADRFEHTFKVWSEKYNSKFKEENPESIP